MSRIVRRAVGVAVAAVLVGATLSACQTNVGVAATIDGQRVTESDVAAYLTSDAKSVTIGQGVSAPPRVFVLDVLILKPFFAKTIAASPLGAVSDRRLAAVHQQQLNGHSDAAVAAQIGVHGYSKAFDKLVVDLSILLSVRSQLSQRINVTALEAKVHFPVHLNPRYGTWSKKSLFINSSGSAGTPAFLQLQPTGAAGS